MKEGSSLDAVKKVIACKEAGVRTFTNLHELVEDVQSTYSNQNLSSKRLEEFVKSTDAFVVGAPSKVDPALVETINGRTWEEYHDALNVVKSGFMHVTDSKDKPLHVSGQLYDLYDASKPVSIPAGPSLESSRLEDVVGSLRGKTVELGVKRLRAEFMRSRPQVVVRADKEEYVACRGSARLSFKDQDVTLHYESGPWISSKEGYARAFDTFRQERAPIQEVFGRVVQAGSVLAGVGLPFVMDWQTSTALAAVGVLGGELVARDARSFMDCGQFYRRFGAEALHERFSSPLLVASVSPEYVLDVLS